MFFFYKKKIGRGRRLGEKKLKIVKLLLDDMHGSSSDFLYVEKTEEIGNTNKFSFKPALSTSTPFPFTIYILYVRLSRINKI